MVAVNGDADRRSSTIIGLLVIGLAGHVIAAWANRGGAIAYVHHIAGFFLIAAVTGAVIGGVTWIFWRPRLAQALLIFAIVQAMLGLMVMLGEFRT
jgi:hypothetical protein